MNFFQYLLLGFLVACAVAVSFSKNLLNSIIIFMSYSLVMSIVWICLESPDLAITEAAVGAGVTSVLFFVTLKKIRAIRQEDEAEDTELVHADAETSCWEASRDNRGSDESKAASGANKETDYAIKGKGME